MYISIAKILYNWNIGITHNPITIQLEYWNNTEFYSVFAGIVVNCNVCVRYLL